MGPSDIFSRGKWMCADVANVEIIHAANQVHLLFQGKLLEQRLDAGFNVGRRRLRGLAQDRQGREQKNRRYPLHANEFHPSGLHPVTSANHADLRFRFLSPFLPLFLSLYSSRAVTFEQGVDFVRGGAAEVALLGVFEAARGHGEFERLLMCGQHLETVNEAGGEGIARAHPVHNVGDFVGPAQR